MGKLFRQEALAAQRRRLLGNVVIAQPLGPRTLTLFVSAFLICLGVFVSTASYSRKATVTGYLSPAQGIVRLGADQRGIVSALLVAEGDVVEAGAPLLSIRSEQVNGDGIDVSPGMIRSVDEQLHEFDELDAIAVARSGQERARLEARIRGLAAEQRALFARLETQRRLVAMAEANLERLRLLAAKGYVSVQDLSAREETLIAAQQLRSALRQEQAATESATRETKAQIGQLPLTLQARRSELRSRRAALEFERLQLTQRQARTILAPVAGTVSAAAVVVGDSVSDSQHLLTLVPSDSELEAHLYVPSRAIGFVSEGRAVRILYDAFDHRRYGAHAGRIREVSSAVLPASETFRRVRLNEPSYRVRVALPDRFERAGRPLALQPGMSLRADIILEERTLLSWLVSPVLALRGRS